MGLRAGLLAVGLLAACGGDPVAPAWTAVGTDQPSALLSVWAASPTDAWVVGGDLRQGEGPVAMHYDGTAWSKLDTGARNVDLWWVTGFADGTVMMSGSSGTILRYRGGAFEKLATPGNLIVFGMWGASSDDVWAVGGTFGSGGFIWRFDGTTWTALAGLPADITTSGTCWKVNGIAANNLWISATNGTTFHWNGSALERVDIPVEASLLSVDGNGDRFVAVGGAFDGLLYENTGTGWKSAIPTGGPRLTGVSVSDADAYAVGQFGTILRRGSGSWATESQMETEQNLHATFIDPTGGVWVVGGQFDTPPFSAGVLLHKGSPEPAPLP